MRTIARFGMGAPQVLETTIRATMPNGDWTDPFFYGTTRIWYDTSNAIFRYKTSNPSTETDGTALMESTTASTPGF